MTLQQHPFPATRYRRLCCTLHHRCLLIFSKTCFTSIRREMPRSPPTRCVRSSNHFSAALLPCPLTTSQPPSPDKTCSFAADLCPESYTLPTRTIDHIYALIFTNTTVLRFALVGRETKRGQIVGAYVSYNARASYLSCGHLLCLLCMSPTLYCGRGGCRLEMSLELTLSTKLPLTLTG